VIDCFADPSVVAGVAALVMSTSRLTAVADHAEQLLRHDRATVPAIERRVLLVHDTPSVLLALASVLDRIGVPVDQAATPAAARAAARRHRPRVAVIDYDLGDGEPSGIQLARELGRGPRVVVITARADLDALVPLAAAIDAEVLPLALDVDHAALVERVRALLDLV